MIVQESFYTVEGFSFQGIARHSYTIRISNKGSFQKMVIMRISEVVRTPETAAKKSQMTSAEDKLRLALTKLQVPPAL